MKVQIAVQYGKLKVTISIPIEMVLMLLVLV